MQNNTNQHLPVSSHNTPFINDLNIDHVRAQIRAKNSSGPFFATAGNAVQTITDHDTFPYPRYYRGIAGLSEPVIAEREAGWCKRHDSCYEVIDPPIRDNYPNHYFQSASSTVYPSHSDEATDCIVEYR